MLLNDRIKSFVALGIRLNNLSESEFEDLAIQAINQNSWFTPDAIQKAIKGISFFLEEDKLKAWIGAYDFSNVNQKGIGVIAAGNIPLVGFHDVLCVLISGHKLMLKMSSSDKVLMSFVLNALYEIDSQWKDDVKIVERLNAADAFIATGSDNSARYFHYYFKNKPNVIRMNRTSVGVLNGEETKAEIESLGNDIFQYYGLGCRNISKLYVPKGYDFVPFLDNLQSFASVADHHKYRNNYDYNKSIYLVNREPHLDTGFLLLRQSEEMVSPISVLFYEEYEDEKQLKSLLETQTAKIQCVVGSDPKFIDFGKAQEPQLSDYADGVDTLAFLVSL